MRIFLRRVVRSNPTSFVAMFGVWAFICGVSLLLPGNLFDYNPSWKPLQLIHAEDTSWGALMAINGILLIASIRMQKIPHRASIAAFSAVMWFLIGGAMVITAIKFGHNSIIGTYSACGALGCLLAVEQWVHNPNDERD